MLKEKGYDCYGLEVSKTAVDIGKKYLKRKKISNIKIDTWKPETSIPFKNKKFKLIIGLQCIYYNLQLIKLIRNLYDNLEEDGQFLFSFFSNRHEYNKYTEEVDEKKTYNSKTDFHKKYQSK